MTTTRTLRLDQVRRRKRLEDWFRQTEAAEWPSAALIEGDRLDPLGWLAFCAGADGEAIRGWSRLPEFACAWIDHAFGATWAL